MYLMYAHRNFDDDEIDDENFQVHVIIEVLLYLPTYLMIYIRYLHKWQETTGCE